MPPSSGFSTEEGYHGADLGRKLPFRWDRLARYDPSIMDDRTKEMLARGRGLYQAHDYDKADIVLREICEHHQSFADVYDMLGVIAHARNDYAAAVRYLEKAVALNPSYTDALLNLAVTYNDLGRYEDARRICEGVRSLGSSGSPTLDPFVRGKIANMHADTGQAYADAGFLTEAIEEYEKALTLSPAYADLRTRLGSLYRDRGDLAQAKIAYTMAKEANPHYAPARIALGVTLLAMGDTPAALREWRELLQFEPDNRSAQMYLRVAELGGPVSSRKP